MIFYNSEDKILFFPIPAPVPFTSYSWDQERLLLFPPPLHPHPIISLKGSSRCYFHKNLLSMSLILSVCLFIPASHLFCLPPSLPSFLSSFSLFQLAPGTSQVIQWLRIQAPNAGDTGLIPAWGTKIPHPAWRSQKRSKQSKYGSSKACTLSSTPPPKRPPKDSVLFITQT